MATMAASIRSDRFSTASSSSSALLLNMEADAENLYVRNERPGEAGGIAAEVEGFGHRVDEISSLVNKLEQKLTDVEQFYSTASRNQVNTSICSSTIEDAEKHIANIKKQQQDASQREAAAAKRMQKLMGQFARILRQITRDEWAWPFMHPVDVKALGLHDYYEVIKKPMDIKRIQIQLEAKDGTGYKHVCDAYADVRLVFNNAMNYNDEKSDVHVMAKTLLEKFEEKWLWLLPRVKEEEKRRAEEEADGESYMQLVREAAYAKKARDISNELIKVDMHLEQLRETVLQKCRKMSTEDKKKLCTALTQLSPEDLNKALEIVAQNNPCFQAMAEEVDLDIDAQSVSTMWKLKLFVKGALDVQGKNSGSMVGNNNHKRKNEICDVPTKTSKKRNIKLHF